jgi:hypothetical protein
MTAHAGNAGEGRTSIVGPGNVAFVPDAGIRNLCGYGNAKHTDSYGRNWEGDRAYIGGSAQINPVRFISRAHDAGLFQTMRIGKFRDHVRLAQGTSELLLYFVETQYGPNNPAGGGENGRLSTYVQTADLFWPTSTFSRMAVPIRRMCVFSAILVWV